MPANPPLPAGPLTWGEARLAGIPDHVVRGPGYRRLLQGVYVASDVPPTVALRARAALLLAPSGAVVARYTAARLWGGVVPSSADVHLVIPPGSRLRVAGIDARARLDPGGAIRAGLPVTSPVRTFTDLASDLGLVDLVVLGDSFVRAGVATVAELRAAAGAGTGRRRHLLRRAANLVRAGVDSPMESRLRLLLVLAGLPEPVVNLCIRDEGGRVVYRLDLAYAGVKVTVEYDGRQHAESATQWQWDVRRREELEADGWRLVVVLAPDLYRQPAHTLERVVSALRDRGMRVTVRGDAWRDCFLGRGL